MAQPSLKVKESWQNVHGIDIAIKNYKEDEILQVLSYSQKTSIPSRFFCLHLGVCITKPKDKLKWEWETIEVLIEESFSEYFGFQNSPITYNEFLQKEKNKKISKILVLFKIMQR